MASLTTCGVSCGLRLIASPSANESLPSRNAIALGLPPRGHASLSARCASAAEQRKQVRMVAYAGSSGGGSALQSAEQEKKDSYFRDHLTVGDCMTKGTLHTVKATTTVDDALEKLVANRISGMPVVDDQGKVVGVVSDYDLLALDSISGKTKSADGIFPGAGSSWKTFKAIQLLLLKNAGANVADVMTPNPLCCRANTNIEDAARVLLQSRFHRLPVVDETGALIGLLTRGNVVRAALMMKRAAEGKGMGPTGGN